MKNNTIKEVIVVEGLHDKQKIETCVNADIIISSGTHFSKKFLDLCDALNKERGLIVFTDPDGPGEMIRRKIIERVGTCKHATLHVKQSRGKGKVGIEHASCEDILEALKEATVFSTVTQTIAWEDFVDLKLTGGVESQKRRDILSETFKFPISNAKRCFKYLNMMSVTYEMAEKALESDGSDEKHSK